MEHGVIYLFSPDNKSHSHPPEDILDLPPDDKEDNTGEERDEGGKADVGDGKLGREDQETSHQ